MTADELTAEEPGVDGRRFDRRTVLAVAALVLLGAIALDWSRAPQHQWSARLTLGSINLYQATFSPMLGNAGVSCRFEPTCSHYGEAVIREHGFPVGAWRSVTRVARCGPWTPRGTVDPPD